MADPSAHDVFEEITHLNPYCSYSSGSFWSALLQLKCQSLQFFLVFSFGLDVGLLKDAFLVLEICDEPC